jgi:Tol biopolymer transport system component
VIATEEYENWPVWSPDSSRIAYGVEGPTGSSVWVIDADGSHNRRLVGRERDAGAPMAWEPGAQIAVNCAGRRPRHEIGVCAVRADGTGFRRLVNDGGFPAWRP